MSWDQKLAPDLDPEDSKDRSESWKASAKLSFEARTNFVENANHLLIVPKFEYI
jgi:hypothetical protein